MEEKFMKEALKEAKKAYDKLEVPVGVVIVKDGKIISRAHNVKEEKKDRNKTCRNNSNTERQVKNYKTGDL